MKKAVYRIKVNASGTPFNERSEHLVVAKNSRQAVDKAIAEAKRTGGYKRYCVESLDWIGDAI